MKRRLGRNWEEINYYQESVWCKDGVSVWSRGVIWVEREAL